MSSIYRDIGESMERIFKKTQIHNLENTTKEELIELLDEIADISKESYVDYSYELGWYDSKEEAENDLEGIEQEIEDRSGYPAFKIQITDWLKDKREFSSNILFGLVEDETIKACRVYILRPEKHISRDAIWIPKSHILKLEQVSSI